MELDSARAGVTARKRWPSALTSKKGAGTSAKFIWKRRRRDFTCSDCGPRFNSALMTWLPVVKKVALLVPTNQPSAFLRNLVFSAGAGKRNDVHFRLPSLVGKIS